MRDYRFRRGRFGRRGFRMHGMIWMVGLGILFFAGHLWPLVLILIGVSLLASFFAGEEAAAPPAESQPFGRPERRSAPYSPPPVIINLPPASPAPTPAAVAPRAEPLPSNCPRCGAPVRTGEVKWTGTQSAACAYCGSNLQAVKK